MICTRAPRRTSSGARLCGPQRAGGFPQRGQAGSDTSKRGATWSGGATQTHQSCEKNDPPVSDLLAPLCQFYLPRSATSCWRGRSRRVPESLIGKNGRIDGEGPPGLLHGLFSLCGGHNTLSLAAAELGEASGARDDAFWWCPHCNEDGFDGIAQLIEHCEDEHAYSQRPVVRSTTLSMYPSAGRALPASGSLVTFPARRHSRAVPRATVRRTRSVLRGLATNQRRVVLFHVAGAVVPDMPTCDKEFGVTPAAACALPHRLRLRVLIPAVHIARYLPLDGARPRRRPPFRPCQ